SSVGVDCCSIYEGFGAAINGHKAFDIVGIVFILNQPDIHQTNPQFSPLLFNHQVILPFHQDGLLLSGSSGLSGLVGLPSNDSESENNCPGGDPFRPCHEYIPPWRVILAVLSVFGAG